MHNYNSHTNVEIGNFFPAKFQEKQGMFCYRYYP